MSAPALKCSPSPSTSVTSRSSRASIAERIAGNARHIAEVIALRRSGRLRTTRANGGSKRRDISVIRGLGTSSGDVFRLSNILYAAADDGARRATANDLRAGRRHGQAQFLRDIAKPDVPGPHR